MTAHSATFTFHRQEILFEAVTGRALCMESIIGLPPGAEKRGVGHWARPGSAVLRVAKER